MNEKVYIGELQRFVPAQNWLNNDQGAFTRCLFVITGHGWVCMLLPGQEKFLCNAHPLNKFKGVIKPIKEATVTSEWFWEKYEEGVLENLRKVELPKSVEVKEYGEVKTFEAEEVKDLPWD